PGLRFRGAEDRRSGRVGHHDRLTLARARTQHPVGHSRSGCAPQSSVRSGPCSGDSVRFRGTGRVLEEYCRFVVDPCRGPAGRRREHPSPALRGPCPWCVRRISSRTGARSSGGRVLGAVGRAFRTPDLRNKLLFTLGIIVLFRLGSFIPSPGIDYAQVQECVASPQLTQRAFGMLNLPSGGALLQLSICALGIMHYITACIITQLLRVVIPRFEALRKEGASGQAKLTQYTRYITLGLAVLNATTRVSTVRTGAL